MKKSLHLNIKPNPDDIEMVRKRCVNFLKTNGFSDRTIKEQTMILRELIEKGKNFTNSKNTENEMTIQLHIEERKITVVLKKSVDESAFRRLEELDKTIQWIRGHQDPFEPYLIKHREACDKHPKSELNGFGLAKIAYKAGAIVDFYVSEDNILNLTAARSLNGDVIS